MRFIKFTPIIITLFAIFITIAGFEFTILAQRPQDEDSSSPDFFIKAEVDNLNPYIGQQVTYKLRRYQALDFPTQPNYEENLFDGFWHTSLIQRPTYTTTIDGREYRVHPTHIALFPTTPGPITIDPAKLIIPGDRPENNIVLTSEAIQLNIKPLPEGAPHYFRGAVGQFEIKAKFKDEEVLLNQATTLIIEVKGNGNISTLLNPSLPETDLWGFDMFGVGPSMTIVDNIPLSKEKVRGKRQFELYLTPFKAGQNYFPVIRFSYFDPETNSYHNLKTDPIPINVLPDSDPIFTSPVSPIRQEVRRLAEDIHHIKPVPTDLSYNPETAIIRQASLLLICFFLSLSTIGTVWVWHRWRQRQLTNSPQVRRHRARRQARQILATAHKSKQDFYASIRLALITYLSDKLNEPIAGLNSDQLITLLNEINLDSDLIERLQTLLTQIDAGHYAPSADKQDPTLVTDIQILIDDLEKFLS